MRVFWGALTMIAEDLRSSFFWIGLEALFGPDSNTGEITYKIAFKHSVSQTRPTGPNLSAIILAVISRSAGFIFC